MESNFNLLKRPTCPTGSAQVVAREDLATAWTEKTYNCRRLTPSRSTSFPIPRPIDPEDTTVLDTTRLVEAKRDVRELLEEGIRRMMAGDDPPDEWVEAAVIERVPSNAQARYRLLALRAAQERAIGVVEAWLDNPSTDPQAREHLTGLLAQILGTNPGAAPDVGGLESLVDDLLARTPEPGELVPATRFVLSVLDLTDMARTGGATMAKPTWDREAQVMEAIRSFGRDRPDERTGQRLVELTDLDQGEMDEVLVSLTDADYVHARDEPSAAELHRWWETSSRAWPPRDRSVAL
jgi:hypothetical protein